MKKIIVLAVCMCFLGTGAIAGADELNELKRQFEQQKKMMKKMEKRIDELEASKKEPGGSDYDWSWLKSIEWVKNLKWSGDIRYRHEYIDDETQATDHRNRHRIRARLKVDAKVNDQVDATVRIATGSSDSATSTNQTLDNTFTSKPIWLDLAFVDYHPNFVPGLDVYLGKMENPFYNVGKHQLFWDGDVTPEGGAITYTHGFFEDQTTINANLGGFWLEERNAGPSVDTSLFGIQTYAVQKLPANMHILGGVSYYDFGSINNRAAVTGGFGNNSNAGGRYIYDYDIVEGFGEFGIKVAGFPIAVYGAYLNNVRARGADEDSAWITGIKFGEAKEPGSFQISYDYREVERDAVVDAINDSDFAGGRSDSKGHKVSAAYQLMKNWQVGLTYFHNDMNWSTTKDELDLLQADLVFKF